ncbi:MAG: 4-(cytidine 5'-diphospho)-2-C-methyl-D-erythritol kinase [Novosphingobium sp.]|nr:4-(cytidine 5'-diphospho)-2-C-methyl-D-erythritol kinase [Novosphingobium sp.]
MKALTETAYAKINLALHVRRRREDGYHEIETLFAFVDAGDVLTAEPAERDELFVQGEFAPALSDGFDNIVAKALNCMPRDSFWRVTLDKRLPVAAGLGGGSADAGAVFRMAARAQGLPEDWRERAAKLGADVPACVESLPAFGQGTGTDLEPGPTDLASVPVLLVNPRLPLATSTVFKTWDGQDKGALAHDTAREIALHGRNDLEAPAIGLCPPVADVLAALAETGAWCVRMSGSGATCFALYDGMDERNAARAAIAAAHPNWWTMPGRLR